MGSKDFALDHNGCQTALKDLLPKNESITDFDIEFQVLCFLDQINYNFYINYLLFV